MGESEIGPTQQPSGDPSEDGTIKKRKLPDALKPFCFKPGKSGNPSGRPKKKPITEAYELILAADLPKELKRQRRLPKDATWALLVALAQIRAAGKGNVSAAKEITDRVEGPVSQTMDLTVNVNEDITQRLRAAHARMQKIKADREAKKASNDGNAESATK